MKVCRSCKSKSEDAREKCKACGYQQFLTAAEVVGRSELPDVSDLILDAGDAMVRGFWKFAGSGGRARVFRREASPPGELGGGDEIELTGPHGFTDRSVRNGQLYYYRVMVEYGDAAGFSVFTTGLVAEATPEPPLVPVEEIQFSTEQGVLHVTWKPPARGEVRVYRGAGEPEWRLGERVPEARLAEVGAPLRSICDGLAVDPAPPAETAFYFPITFAGESAVMGKSRLYVAAPEVTKLSARDHGSYIQLQWQWPAGCNLAVVVWRDDAAPDSAQDPRAESRTITRGDYERNGGLRLQDLPKTPYRFAVFAATTVDGQTFYSEGRSPGSRFVLRPLAPVVVSYSISRGGGWRRQKPKITLRSAEEVAQLPDVVVVARRGDVEPQKKDEGVALMKISGLRLRAHDPVERQFNLDSVREPFRLRAFFDDPSAGDDFELREER